MFVMNGFSANKSLSLSLSLYRKDTCLFKNIGIYASVQTNLGLFRLDDFVRTTLSCMILSCMIYCYRTASLTGYL